MFVEAGKNYFIRQYIKLGVFVGGAGFELIPEEQGKTAVANLELAASGPCRKYRCSNFLWHLFRSSSRTACQQRC